LAVGVDHDGKLGVCDVVRKGVGVERPDAPETDLGDAQRCPG
jgi:hypothetical protein